MYGEQVAGYPVGMLNEREVRAGAGILFAFGIVSFMIAILTNNFEVAKFMIIGFLFDFVIRIINPKYAPSLVVGRIVVGNQKVEYVGAKQKRFAWAIGVVLALIMLWTMVIHDVRGPINIIVCGSCLLLLFIESAFGICLGCKVYNIFDKEQQQYCAGGVCEVRQKEAIQKVGGLQLLSVAVLIALLFSIPMMLSFFKTHVEKDCTVPQFAIDIGHEELWKEHNGCN